MKIIHFFAKIWGLGLGIFLFITYIIPRERPFANGQIYIDLATKDKNKIIKISDNDKLYFDNMDQAIKSLHEINEWMKKNKINKIVFYIPQYQSIIFYIHLKQQNLIQDNNVFIGTTPEGLKLKKIFFTYHQTLGVIFEYILDCIKSFFKKTKSIEIN